MKRDPRTKGLARAFRRNLTPAESILWRHLRGRRFAHFKFRRQHPVGPYFADFACIHLGLIVELDGECHLTTEERDARRTESIEAEGWLVLRFWNTQVYEETEAVLERI